MREVEAERERAALIGSQLDIIKIDCRLSVCERCEYLWVQFASGEPVINWSVIAAAAAVWIFFVWAWVCMCSGKLCSKHGRRSDTRRQQGLSTVVYYESIQFTSGASPCIINEPISHSVLGVGCVVSRRSQCIIREEQHMPGADICLHPYLLTI